MIKPTAIKPAVKSKLYIEVTNQIISLIKQGEWVPGSLLPSEAEMAKAFQVSRNCTREALKALELLGIIQSQPGKGTYLTDSALQSIESSEMLSVINDSDYQQDLMETRFFIETQTAYLAARRAKQEDIEELEKLIIALEKAAKNKEEIPNAGYNFHMMIARMSKNKVMYHMYASLSKQLIVHRAVSSAPKKKISDYDLVGHRKLFEAIRDGKANEAYDLMLHHLKITHKDHDYTKDLTPLIPV